MSPLTALRFALASYRRRWLYLASGLVATIGGWIILELAVVAGQPLGIVFWALARVAFLTFGAGMHAGILRACLELHDGGDPSFGVLFSKLSLAPAMLMAQALFSVAVLAGLALVVLPGAYLAARWGLFGFSLALGEEGIGESFRASFRATTSAWPRVLVLLAILLLLNAVGAALLGIGLLVTLPISYLALASAYRQLVPAGEPATDAGGIGRSEQMFW